MATMYYAAFDVSLISGLGTLTITRSAFSNVVITLDDVVYTSVEGPGNSSIFFHGPFNAGSQDQRVTGQDPSSTIKLTHYARRAFCSAVTNTAQAAASFAGWTNPTNLTVTFAQSTGLYTIAATGYNVGYTFSTAAGGALMSFSDLSEAAAASHTGTIVPTYAIAATLPSVSDDTPNYEPDGIANHLETDNGQGGGISRTVSPQYRSWRQEYETKAKTIRAAAASTHPWTFQHLFEHCRGNYAFSIIDGFGAGTNEVFSLRTSSTSSKPRRATPGNDNQFHIDFDTCVEGTMASYTP